MEFVAVDILVQLPKMSTENRLVVLITHLNSKLGQSDTDENAYGVTNRHYPY